MQINWFVDPGGLPGDGSRRILDRFIDSSRDPGLCLQFFPDIHHKQGSVVVNGMLTASPRRIFPAMIGVANCGFSFVRLCGAGIEETDLVSALADFARELPQRHRPEPLSAAELDRRLQAEIIESWEKGADETPRFLGVRTVEDLLKLCRRLITPALRRVACRSLGTLGGGNHFLELHRVAERFRPDCPLQPGDFLFLLHSDSVAVGDRLYLYVTGPSAFSSQPVWKRPLLSLRLAVERWHFWSRLEPRPSLSEWLRLASGNSPGFSLDVNSALGRALLQSQYLGHLFGEMNRRSILEALRNLLRRRWPRVDFDFRHSHSHDSLRLERMGKQLLVVQRNGVQRVGDDAWYLLPGALGTDAYLMANPGNARALFSANHGAGRLRAKEESSRRHCAESVETLLNGKGFRLFRIGEEALTGQHPDGFRDVSDVAEQMEAYGLGRRAARLIPLAGLKG